MASKNTTPALTPLVRALERTPNAKVVALGALRLNSSGSCFIFSITSGPYPTKLGQRYECRYFYNLTGGKKDARTDQLIYTRQNGLYMASNLPQMFINNTRFQPGPRSAFVFMNNILSEMFRHDEHLDLERVYLVSDVGYRHGESVRRPTDLTSLLPRIWPVGK